MLRHVSIKVLVPAFLLLGVLFALAPASALAASGPPKLGPTASQRLHIVSPDYYYCDPGWVYDNVTNAGNNFIAVTPTYRSYNGTPYNATTTFTATTTGTVAMWTTIGAQADASIIVAGVDVSLSITVYASISTSIGHAMTITVPPYKAGYGQYGVLRKVTNGHYYYLTDRCGVSNDKGTVQAKSPWYPNWNTWIGS
jgi:hypothetical protein